MTSKSNELIDFKRQYIISTKQIDKLKKWNLHKFDRYNIYTEKSLEIYNMQKEGLDLFLLGYWIDPYHPKKSNESILRDMFEKSSSLDSIFKFIYPLSGRFLLLVKIHNNSYVLNDASGFRTAFYHKNEKNCYITSNISLLNYVEQIQEKKCLQGYFKSDHYLHGPTFMWQAGFTFFEEVEHLIPNHYLDLNKFKSVRFFQIKDYNK